MNVDPRLINVILLGFGFMFVFTAFQTMGNIEQTVLQSIHQEKPSFNGDGYYSLAIVYSVFAASNWIAPSIISLIGPRISMVIGGIIYTLFILSFLIPQTWLLYLMSSIIGIGAAIIWTAQGNYLVLNSSKDTINRNSGIFWAMLQCSMFFGNLFVSLQFQDQKTISKETRTIVFIVLGVVAALGIGFFAVLRPPKTVDGIIIPATNEGPIEALTRSLRLFGTKNMLLLTITFFYTGIELSFFSGVYGTSIGNTRKFGSNAKLLVGISGIFVGLGEVIGGFLFSILGKKTVRWGRDPIVIVGFVVHMLSFFLIFINIPNEAPLEETATSAYITSDQYLAIFCSFLLGFGDSCYNTQIYSMIGSIWEDDSAPAMAIFKFVQSVGAAACFFYSKAAWLHAHLGVLIGLSTIGTVTFCAVEWIEKAKQKRNSDTSSSSSNSSNAD